MYWITRRGNVQEKGDLKCKTLWFPSNKGKNQLENAIYWNSKVQR